MNDLEQAARQALEALIWTTGSTDFGRGGQANEGALKLLFPAINALREALEQQPKQEPVAWLDEDSNLIYRHNTHKTDDYHGLKRTTPLYTEPLQREPLTDELSILKAVSDEYNAWIRYHAGGGSYDEFLANTLAAHGITGEMK